MFSSYSYICQHPAGWWAGSRLCRRIVHAIARTTVIGIPTAHATHGTPGSFRVLPTGSGPTGVRDGFCRFRVFLIDSSRICRPPYSLLILLPQSAAFKVRLRSVLGATCHRTYWKHKPRLQAALAWRRSRSCGGVCSRSSHRLRSSRWSVRIIWSS